MKAALIVLLFAVPLVAQNLPANSPPACGPDNVTINVKLDATDHSQPPPEPGKARIFFIHDAGTSHTALYPTIKIGIDGKWVGANRKNSYFSVSIEPGEHHVCVSAHTYLRDRVELAHFTWEAGKVYFLRTRLIADANFAEAYLEFQPVDADEAQDEIGGFPRATATPRK